ncbi:MAG TPA: acyl-CoA-binding protein [Candidatus Acidoferrales bacterium]|nr:acyl-CoA-binding protein [Candidatus Acidoferrales bacterium]
MSDLTARFTQAQADANTLPERPDNDTLLKLYALYKQATQGDVTGDQPGVFDFVKRAKYDAWAAMRGTPAQSAMEQYVALVGSLRR